MRVKNSVAPQHRQSEHFNFPLRKIALLLAGLSIWGSTPLYAAEAAAGSAAPGAEQAAKAEEPKAEEAVLLDAVVVRTARRPIEKLHDVASSSSIVSGEELNRELAQDLAAITKRGANISYNQNNTRGASLSIRGLGKGRAFQETQDPNVGITVDGISYGLNQLGNFDFYDIDTVEVSRGPQGTLGGRGGSSGVVVFNTKRPSFTANSDFSLTYGQRQDVIAKANTGGALIEDLLAWRGSFVVDKSTGAYSQNYDTNYTFYNKDRVSGRAQFLLTPSADFTALVSVDLEPKAPQLQNGLTQYVDTPITYANGSLVDPNGTGGAGGNSRAQTNLAGFTNASGVFTAGRTWFTGRNFPTPGVTGQSVGANNFNYSYNDYLSSIYFNENQGQTVSNNGASALLSWVVGNHTVTSATGVRNYTFDAHNDEGTPFDINKNGGGAVYYRQISEELKISSNPGTGPFEYTAGLYSLNTKNDVQSKAGWGADAGAWFATNAQYNTLYRNAGTNIGSGAALLKDSLQDAFTKGDTFIDTQSNAIYGNLNWHFSEAASLTTGVRATSENRSTLDNKFLVASGAGAALNPVAVRGVQLGGFASSSTGALTAANSASQLSLADSVAAQYFGVAATATPGGAYNSLTAAQKAQVAAAKAIRAAQLGTFSNDVVSNYKDTLYTSVITPSYKFNDDFTGYVSWQHGEKSGSGLNINYVNAPIKSEKTDSFELGLKSFLFDKTLTLNVDAYFMNIRDYQTTVRAVDEFTTASNLANGMAANLATAYLTVQGNVPKVQAKGLEIDGVYSGITNTSIRFSGAYTDARYIDFTNAAKPEELGYLSSPFVDQSGYTLPGVAKWTFNLGAEYHQPLSASKQFHTSINTAYTSSYNATDNLSAYGNIDAYFLTDASIGIGSNVAKNKFDVNLVVKNLFDKNPHETAWASYTPYAHRRWVGISFSSSL